MNDPSEKATTSETDQPVNVTPDTLTEDERDLLYAYRHDNYLKIAELFGKVAAEQPDKATKTTLFLHHLTEQVKKRERDIRQEYERDFKLNNRRVAYGIIGRLVQTGLLLIEDFNPETSDQWQERVELFFDEIVAVLDYI